MKKGADLVASWEYRSMRMVAPYKKSLASNDKSKATKIEAFIRSIEDEKIDLEKKWQPCLRNSHQIRIKFLELVWTLTIFGEVDR